MKKVPNFKVELKVVITACRRHRALRTLPWIDLKLGWLLGLFYCRISFIITIGPLSWRHRLPFRSRLYHRGWIIDAALVIILFNQPPRLFPDSTTTERSPSFHRTASSSWCPTASTPTSVTFKIIRVGKAVVRLLLWLESWRESVWARAEKM